MADASPIGRLKASLIAHLIDAIETGEVVVNKETGEKAIQACSPALLSVAAKVVKDFHQEAGKDPSVTELEGIIARYQDKKAGRVKTAH